MKRLVISALAASLGVAAMAQTVNLTTFADNGYLQSFDTLNSTGTVDLTPTGGEFGALPGWYYGKVGVGLTTAGQNKLQAENGGGGTATTGQFKSYGAPSSTERALGSVASGTPGNMAYGARFVNGTGTSTGLFVVQFDLEQWRNGGTATQQGLGLSYKLVKGGVPSFSQADFNLGTGYITTGIKTQTTNTGDTGLTGLSPESNSTTILGPIATSTAAALDGNALANSVRVRTVIQLFANGSLFEPGDEIIFRWSDLDDTGTDHGFGIDNVEAVPEPASMMAIGLGIAGLAARRRRAAK